jgi:hypothetical protein
VYAVVVITITRVPYVVAIMATVVLSYLAYRRRPSPPKWGMWPAIFAVLALYEFLAALAPAGWDEPLVLLGIGFAALSGYAWLDPARRRPSAGARQTSGGAGGSVRGLGAAGGATSFEEDTSHTRPGTARRPAYRRWHVAQGLQGALGALDGRHGRGDDLGRNGRRVQGRWEGRSERGRRSVAHGAYAPDFLSPPVEPISRVSVLWAGGRI